MRGATRFAVVLIGIVCVVWAVYNAVAPDRYAIQMFALQSDGAQAHLVVNVPASNSMPVRTGDELDVGATTIDDRIQYFSQAIAGSTVNVPLVRSGQRVNVGVLVPPGLVPPPRWIDLILVILYVAFGFAVMVRAGNHALGRMVVWLAIVELGGTVCADFGYTAPTPGLAFYAGECPTVFFEAATSFIAVWAATFLPSGARLRKPAFAVALALAALLTTTNVAQVVPVFYPLLSSALSIGIDIAAILVSLAMAVVLITIAQAAPSDQRMRSMWFVSTLIGWFVGSALGILLNFGYSAAWLFWASYLLQSFTLLGPIYASLRHRLVDLNFVVTRSAIYAMLSVLMLGSFVGAEWVAGKVADAVLEGAFWKGVAAQLLSFAVAILIGLYLRSVHSHLEDWVNGLLFRERIRKLNLLESFARESDLVQTRSELLGVTYEALRDSIDADEFAVYVAADGALDRAHGRSAPERLERDDRVVLQLLERQCSFVSQVPSLRDWLLIPLAVRRDIVGAIACAPKRDRTAYLPDEQRVLNDVARRVATSYALLLPAFGPTPAAELRR